MSTTTGDELLAAMKTGELETEVIPEELRSNPADTEVYDIVVRIGADEIARVGVWKTSAGGVIGEGEPRVHINGTNVEVVPGDRMGGGFDVACNSDDEADEVADLLSDRLSEAYEGIEVEIANS